MPHNRCVPADSRPLVLRGVAAVVAMTVVMLAIAALGRWVLITAPWAARMDEGGLAAGGEIVAAAPWIVDVARTWSALSGPWVIHPIVIALALWLLLSGRARRSVLLVPAVGLVGWALGALCKEVVQRARPDEAVVAYGSWSFPSGHANNAALGAVLLVTLLALVRTAWIRWGATALVVVGALLTAADRIVLGVHYVTDVTAGLALGALMALVGLGVLRPDLRPPPATDA